MKKSIKLWRISGMLFLAVVSLFPVPGQAQNIVITHCQGQCPQYDSNLAATRAKIVVHHTYAAGLNGDSGLPDWVAYHLTAEAAGVASLLPRDWQPDRLVNFSGALELIELGDSEITLAEITSSGNPYAGLNEPPAQKPERVRLAPMTSFANSPYWSELNNLSNMLPMPSPLRLGAWLQLEQSLNQLVAANEELYVVSGPLFLISQPLSTAPSTAALNPAAYFKIVMDSTGIAAFVFPQDLGQHESFCDQRSKLAQIEAMSRLQFFPDRAVSESPRLLAALNCAD